MGTKWEKLPAYDGQVHQGCLNCEPVKSVAPMDMLIGVGFGVAQVTKGNELVFDEMSWLDKHPDEYPPTLEHFEVLAREDPDHDWRVLLHTPLRSREYQRHGEDEWVLVDSGPGFA